MDRLISTNLDRIIEFSNESITSFILYDGPTILTIYD